jgi:hypothetical protein
MKYLSSGSKASSAMTIVKYNDGMTNRACASTRKRTTASQCCHLNPLPPRHSQRGPAVRVHVSRAASSGATGMKGRSVSERCNTYPSVDLFGGAAPAQHVLLQPLPNDHIVRAVQLPQAVERHVPQQQAARVHELGEHEHLGTEGEGRGG